MNSRFLHVSDTHYRNDGGASLRSRNATWDPGEVLKKFLAKTDYSEYDFIAVTGDLLNDGYAADYEALREILEAGIPDGMPLLVMLGNHDDKPAFYQGWLGQGPSDKPYYYAQTVGDLRVIVMDTGVSWQHGGSVDEEQVEWFANLTSTPGGALGSVILQHHPYEIGWESGQEQFLASPAFREALAVSDVRAVFTGHLHMSRSSLVYGIPQYTTSSMAWGIHRVNQKFWDTAQLGYSTCEIARDHIDYCHQVFSPDIQIIGPADVNSDYADLSAQLKGVF